MVSNFLLIDDNPLTNGIYEDVGFFPIECSLPDDILHINASLSRVLVNLLKFTSGRTFDNEPNSTHDDWSRMIWDLLGIAAVSFSKKRNAKLANFSLLNSECLFCYRICGI